MAELTPRIGDYVMYRQNGIFRVTDLREEHFHSSVKKQYLVLTCVQDESMTVFVPADREHVVSLLRSPLTRDKLIHTIRQADAISLDWIEDTKKRGAVYGALLQSGDFSTALSIYRALLILRERTRSEKRKFYASDEKVLVAAERIVCDETSFVLGTSKEEARDYLLCHLKTGTQVHSGHAV